MSKNDIHWGCDEAGLGPIIGPLAMVMTGIRGNPEALQAVDVKDSKKLHKSGDLRPLERVALGALGWFGWPPENVAELFGLLRTHQESREQSPWLQNLEDIALPLTDIDIPEWSFPDCQPLALSGSLVAAAELTDAATNDINRSELELQRWQEHWQASELIATLNNADVGDCSLIVDRLGGRRYYQQALQAAWPQANVTINEEGQGASAYQLSYQQQQWSAQFLVKADLHHPTVALSSIIAKYCREVEMHLLNTFWSNKMRWLKKTAGYPQDGKRWWFQLGEGNQSAYGRYLLRGFTAEEH